MTTPNSKRSFASKKLVKMNDIDSASNSRIEKLRKSAHISGLSHVKIELNQRDKSPVDRVGTLKLQATTEIQEAYTPFVASSVPNEQDASSG